MVTRGTWNQMFVSGSSHETHIVLMDLIFYYTSTSYPCKLTCFVTRIKASFPRSTFFLLLPYIFCCKLLCKLWSCCLLVLLVQVMKSHEAVLCSRLACFAQFAKVRFRKEFFVLQLPLDRARRRPTQNWSVMRTHWDGFQKSVTQSFYWEVTEALRDSQ